MAMEVMIGSVIAALAIVAVIGVYMARRMGSEKNSSASLRSQVRESDVLLL
jgi:hypothetical protein